MKKSITVEFWNKIYLFLSYISIYKLVTLFIKNKSAEWRYNFIDIWVLSNFFSAFFSIFLIKYLRIQMLDFILVIYGFLRVFEVIIYQINVLLFDEYRARKKGKVYKLRGYRRMIINLFTNFGEIIFWFASSYAFFSGALFNSDMTIVELIFNSFCIMTTFGLPNLKINTEIGLYILWFQSISGLLMTLLSISRFIGLMPKVETMDEFEI